MFTLPLRLAKSFIRACFAAHHRYLTSVIAFVALFGFWEVFNGLVKDPLISLFKMKSSEYQSESFGEYRDSIGNSLYSNYRATKFVLQAEYQAIRDALYPLPSPDGTDEVSDLDGFLLRMSRSLDQQERRAWDRQRDGGNEHSSAFRVGERRAADRARKQPRPRPKAASPPPVVPAPKLGALLVVDVPGEVPFFQIRDAVLIERIKHGDDISRELLSSADQVLLKGVRVHAVLRADGEVATATMVEGHVQPRAYVIALSTPNTYGAISAWFYSGLQAVDGKTEPMVLRMNVADHYRVQKVSGAGVRYAVLPRRMPDDGILREPITIDGTLSEGSRLVPGMTVTGDGRPVRAGTTLPDVGPLYRFFCFAGEMADPANGQEILVPASDLRGKTEATAMPGSAR